MKYMIFIVLGILILSALGAVIRVVQIRRKKAAEYDRDSLTPGEIDNGW